MNPVTNMMNAIDLPGNRDRQLSQVERPDAPGQINNIWPCDIDAYPFQTVVAFADTSLDMLREWMVASGISTRDHTAPFSFESAKVLHLSRQRRKTHLPKKPRHAREYYEVKQAVSLCWQWSGDFRILREFHENFTLEAQVSRQRINVERASVSAKRADVRIGKSCRATTHTKQLSSKTLAKEVLKWTPFFGQRG